MKNMKIILKYHIPYTLSIYFCIEEEFNFKKIFSWITNYFESVTNQIWCSVYIFVHNGGEEAHKELIRLSH